MADPTYEFHIDFDGDGDFDDTGEDVTERIRDTIDIGYGRDQVRSLSPPRVGETNFELDNISRDYSPENDSSPLAGNILPAREVRIQATHDAQTYNLFRGFTDGFDVLPALPQRRVRISCLDALARFRDVRISTELHHGIRTGEAVGIVLDAIGWPEDDRDLDIGATTIPWFWLDREDGLTALEQIVNSEGPAALGAVDGDGKFVFRDRHHRLVRSASLTSQATLSDDGTEPMISDDVIYDHGWRDIVNSVTLSVEERAPAGVVESVWSSDLIYSVADGETLTVRAQPSDPVLNAIVPVEDTDYRLRSGAVDVALSRTSGTAIAILITGDGGPAVLDQLQLRAFPVTTRRTVEVEVSDPVSIDRFGVRAPNLDAPWANQHDALAIGQIVLAHRAERLPIVTVRLDGQTDERLTQQLARDLSDRVTIDESEIGLDDDFYIERIDHVISHAGLNHVTSFGCEKVTSQIDSAFTFDVAGRGFDDGNFGKQGLDDPDNVFRFDTAGQGFDDGLLAT